MALIALLVGLFVVRRRRQLQYSDAVLLPETVSMQPNACLLCDTVLRTGWFNTANAFCVEHSAHGHTGSLMLSCRHSLTETAPPVMQSMDLNGGTSEQSTMMFGGKPNIERMSLWSMKCALPRLPATCLFSQLAFLIKLHAS